LTTVEVVAVCTGAKAAAVPIRRAATVVCIVDELSEFRKIQNTK
jgi:hypothetical protein